MTSHELRSIVNLKRLGHKSETNIQRNWIYLDCTVDKDIRTDAI